MRKQTPLQLTRVPDHSNAGFYPSPAAKLAPEGFVLVMPREGEPGWAGDPGTGTGTGTGGDRSGPSETAVCLCVWPELAARWSLREWALFID